MKYLHVHLNRASFAALFCGAFLAFPMSGHTDDGTVVIRAGLMFDGTSVQENVDVEVRDGRIAAIRPANGNADVDLGQRMLAPGLIDTHVHLTWYITSQGRLNGANDGDDERTAMLNAAGNAWRTLQAGFTTVQSVGAGADKILRDAINSGVIPGPRVLTSLGQISLRNVGDAAVEAAIKVRGAVRSYHANGADLIKVFADDGPERGGPAQQAVLEAACGEARALGLRSMVHANTAESVKAAVGAGCTHIAHGAYADEEAIDMMAAAGVYFEPQCSLVILNYLANWQWFEKSPGWDDTRKQSLERLLVGFRDTATRWLKVASLKVAYGSDAVAGAHGLNAADLVCRVRDLGQPAMDALRSATAGSAEAIGLGDRIGRIAPGYDADLVAFDGDPRDEPESFLSVAFVMKGGIVYRMPPDMLGPRRVFPARQ